MPVAPPMGELMQSASIANEAGLYAYGVGILWIFFAMHLTVMARREASEHVWNRFHRYVWAFFLCGSGFLLLGLGLRGGGFGEVVNMRIAAYVLLAVSGYLLFRVTVAVSDVETPGARLVSMVRTWWRLPAFIRQVREGQEKRRNK